MKSQRKTFVLTSLVLSSMLVATSLANAGYYYESISTEQMQGKRDSSEMNVKAWVDGDKGRVEFTSGEKKGWFAVGNYLITTDGGETIHLVNPGDETYGKFSMEEMMATLGQAMDMMKQMGGMMKMEFSDVSSEKLLEEPGESMLGYSTTHYRYKSHYTMSMSMMGIKQRNTIDMIQDIWSTGELGARGFGVWLRPDRRMQTGNEDLDKLMNQQMGMIKGFPLKMVNEMTTTNKKGKTQKSTSFTEVIVLREEVIDGNLFEWPSHYTEVQIMPSLEGYNQQAGESKKKSSFLDMFKRPDGG